MYYIVVPKFFLLVQNLPNTGDEHLKIFDWNILVKYISKTKQSTAVAGSTFRKYYNRSWSCSSYLFQSTFFGTKFIGGNMTYQGDHLKQGYHLKPKYWDARYGGCRRGLYVRWASASATSGGALDGGWWARGCVVFRNSLWYWQNKYWIKSWQQLTESWNAKDETNLIESQSTSTHEVQFETMISPAQGLHLSVFPSPLLSF